MIVEDSKLAALAIKTALNGFGYDDVVMVSDGLEAVKLEKEVEPDLIPILPKHTVRCWLYQSHEEHVAPLAEKGLLCVFVFSCLINMAILNFL